ncbi:hypothetical protein J6369_17465, partial [Leptospira interrogans serovar Copenhageni]|nr:hypothetical protein [Leptospira interrogans serovar Copenhageni]MBO8006666.1 hypothetical protein [Leptospira interrogans serovar Icterohaemorrhagiae]MBO7992058.1 hypothetical protein [Leptospira interrogans serovar Copenhageni]MBO8002964.1 hypothetical protein [Leptospira interrogans serovar Copenhageni]MBO8010223.1 hypothetical protein [Leptospira interrogans serovar Copenhageni]
LRRIFSSSFHSHLLPLFLEKKVSTFMLLGHNGDQQNYFNCPFQCNRNGWKIYFSTTLFPIMITKLRFYTFFGIL